MDVILPQNTKNQIGLKGNARNGKYKTAYLLHGMSDDQTIWQRRTSIERYVSEYGIAVVMPDGGLSFYTDMCYGLPYWTFFSVELPKICREFFPQMSDRKEDTWQPGCLWGVMELGSSGLEPQRRLARQRLCQACWTYQED